MKNNEIYYKTINGKGLDVFNKAAFGRAMVISNIYKNGQGVLTFDREVTSIGDDAFQECSSLASIEIPNSVTSIGSYAFYGCSSLASITYNDTKEKWASISKGSEWKSGSAFTVYCTDGNIDLCSKIYYTSTDGNIVTPNKTNFGGAKIVSNTYENGQGVITFDREVTSIGESAFYGCSGLTSVTIPNSVTSIEEGAFSNCSCLTSITIPNSVTRIGSGAFWNCRGLTSITIPNSVTSIGTFTFYGCKKLTSCIVPDSVSSIGDRAFYNTLLVNKIIKDNINKDTLITYKGFSKNLVCINKQYKLDEINSVDGEILLCNNGIHSCILPVDVLGYYKCIDNVYYQIKVNGDKDYRLNDDSKIATRNCKLIKKLSKDDLIKETIKMINEYSK